MRHRCKHYAILLLGLITIIYLASCACKPGPVIEWSRTFGGKGGDQGRSVQQTQEGGYIICGGTTSYRAGRKDMWLIKTDAEGNKLWDKTFGGEKDDSGNAVQQTTDGDYMVCGVAGSYRWDETMVWLIKTDAEGNKLWDKTFGSTLGYTHGFSAQQTTDCGYIVCGYTSAIIGPSEVLLLKIVAER